MLVPMFLAWTLFLSAARLLVAVIAINGLLMLASPAAWRRTPWWFRSFAGIPGDTRTPIRNGTRIRLIGAALLVVTIVLTYYVVCHYPPEPSVRIVRIPPPPSRTI
ncbi:MAG TPA: hypothetical protein VKB38_12295 [Terracidiphilus sp.]|nr:hypothetical protein [Terracidiphilus sp.]